MSRKTSGSHGEKLPYTLNNNVSPANVKLTGNAADARHEVKKTNS